MTTNNCHICGESKWKLLYSKLVVHPLWGVTGEESNFPLNYFNCQECGLIKLDPVLSFEQSRQYYEMSSAPSQASFGKRAPMLEQRRAFLLQHLGPGAIGRVVEVGPAYGDFLLTLESADERIGIEPSTKYCDFVKEKHPELRYYPFMLESLSLDAPELIGTAELVVSCNVLEHTTNPKTFVQSLMKVVRQDGLLLLEVPGVEAMSECPTPCYQTLHPGHIYQFSAPTVNRLCASIGLQLVAMESSSTLDYPVLRALFRKSATADLIASLFRRHCDGIDAQTSIAKQAMLEAVDRCSRSVIWGCGQDLLDILNICSEAERVRINELATVIDRNGKKQGKRCFEVTVASPDDVSEAVDLVVIPSRSEILCEDIRSAALTRFPGAEIICCYS